MRKWFFLMSYILILQGCNTGDGPECFKAAGKIVAKEVEVEAFQELIVYKGINLFLEQGEEHKVIIESGENLIGEIIAEVDEGRLSLRNENNCNFFRDYGLTNVYVTVPDLTWLQNAGNRTLEGVGELHFPDIWLRSLNQEKISDVYTIGDFRLHLFSENIRVTSDNYSNFFLSGSTNTLDLYIADGDTRFEGAELISETIEIQHRGTNKLIVNPQKELKGEIRSTGDVISVSRPSVVDIEIFYSGQLYLP